MSHTRKPVRYLRHIYKFCVEVLITIVHHNLTSLKFHDEKQIIQLQIQGLLFLSDNLLALTNCVRSHMYTKHLKL